MSVNRGPTVYICLMRPVSGLGKQGSGSESERTKNKKRNEFMKYIT